MPYELRKELDERIKRLQNERADHLARIAHIDEELAELTAGFTKLSV